MGFSSKNLYRSASETSLKSQEFTIFFENNPGTTTGRAGQFLAGPSTRTRITKDESVSLCKHVNEVVNDHHRYAI